MDSVADTVPGISRVVIWSPILPGRDRTHEEALSEEQIIGFLRDGEAGIAVTA